MSVRTLFVASALVASPLAHAQSTPSNRSSDEATPIDEVVVTAAPLGRTVEELIQPANVLQDEALMLRAAASIGETLANEAGVSSTYFGPIAGRPVIRGQSGPRISVLQSGVGTLDVADLSPDHAVPVEPLFVDRVEILRGPATLLYGSSAAGGVVNVIDSRIPYELPDDALTAAFEARADTATGEQVGALRLDGAVDSFAWHIDAFDRESDDIEIPGFATADPALRDDEEPEDEVRNSFGDSRGYAAGGTWFGDRGSIGLSVSQYENVYGLPGPKEEEEPEPGEPAEPELFPGPFIDLEQTRFDLRAERRFDGWIESAKLIVGVNDYEHQEIEPSGEVATTFVNEAVETRVELVHAPIAGWRGALGVQLIDRDFSAVGEEAFLPPTDTQSVGLFLLEERATDFGRIEFGARVETLEHEPAAALSGYDETAFSLALGADWNLSDRTDLRFNLSRSERHPDAAELYADGPHLATGFFETGLVPQGFDVEQEVSTNLDIGVHYHIDGVDLRATVFYNDVADHIELFETAAIEDGLPVAEFRQNDARFHGAEVELEWFDANGASPWSGRVFADYVRGRNDNGDLPRIQPGRLGTSVRYDAERWAVDGEAIYHAEQDQVSSFQTDAFTMVNASVIWRLPQGRSTWDLFLRASNLLDEEARRSTSFRAAFVPLPGRNFQLGVRYQFN